MEVRLFGKVDLYFITTVERSFLPLKSAKEKSVCQSTYAFLTSNRDILFATLSLLNIEKF